MGEQMMTNPLLVAQQAATTQPSRPARIDEAKAEAAAQEFEAVFLSQMLEHMFAGIRTDGPFSGGSAETTYRSLMINQYGKQIAKSGGIGIAGAVMAEMLKIQEEQS